MKTQNLFYGLLIVLLFMGTACSNNDDGETKTLSEQFTGTWKPVKNVIVCSTGTSDIENLTVCEQTGRLTVKQDGTWTETYFYEYIDNMCEDDGVSNGTWKIVNDKLFVTENGSGEIEITVFEIIENILQVGQYDTEFLCDGDKPSSHYYREYIKV